MAGGYDVYARAIARHWGRHIAGNPNSSCRTCRVPGSNNAAEHVFSRAPKDGTLVGAVFPGAIVGKLLEEKTNFKFDPQQFIYIGTADSGTRVCATWHASKIKTFADVQKNETVIGASAAGGSTRDYGYWPTISRARSFASCRATRAPLTSGSQWSAGRSTDCAASTGPRSSRRSRSGSKTSNSTSWCRSR